MKTLGAITDPIFVKPEEYSAVDRFFLKLMRDERDPPFIYLSTIKYISGSVINSSLTFVNFIIASQNNPGAV